VTYVTHCPGDKPGRLSGSQGRNSSEVSQVTAEGSTGHKNVTIRTQSARLVRFVIRGDGFVTIFQGIGHEEIRTAANRNLLVTYVTYFLQSVRVCMCVCVNRIPRVRACICDIANVRSHRSRHGIGGTGKKAVTTKTTQPGRELRSTSAALIYPRHTTAPTTHQTPRRPDMRTSEHAGANEIKALEQNARSEPGAGRREDARGLLLAPASVGRNSAKTIQGVL